MPHATRRNFLKAGATVAATSAIAMTSLASAAPSPVPSALRNPLPRWRGFNLMPFFTVFSKGEDYSNQKVPDLDLQWIRDWGFDYIRLPIDYWFFVQGSWRQTGKMNPEDIRRLDEEALGRLDAVVERCQKYGLHLTLNMHRAPGYCINGWEREPFNLWKDAGAEDAFVFFWETLARRYRGISAAALSFNLVNEAPNVNEKMSRGDYRRVMLRAERTIHGITPDRIVIIDGTGVGREVVMNMTDEPVAQAFHAYDPFRLTHYKATWVGNNSDWPVPEWPYPHGDGSQFGPRQLAVELAPWAELVRQGVGVHCGEFGSYFHTPHHVVIAWISEVLGFLKAHDIGFALWNFRGDFGVLDSNRSDVAYEDWYGHKLDRVLLDLLRTN